MGTTLELPKPQIDGKDVEADVVEELLSEREILAFDYEKEGKKLTCHMMVDGSRVTVDDLNQYQTAFAVIMADAEAKEQEEIAKHEARARQRKKVKGASDEIDAEAFGALGTVSGFMTRIAQIEAHLLAKAIMSWNVPHIEPGAEVLYARTGPGPAARAALKAWFFPTSSAPAEATGTSDEASTPNTSAT